MSERVIAVLRTSARPYLVTIVVALVVGGYAEYLRHYLGVGIPVLFGQAPDIYLTAFGVLIAGILWLLYRGARTREPLLVAFLVLLVVTWLAHWLLSRHHGDAFTYAVLLYIPVVVALWWKTPDRAAVVFGLQALGWALVSVLIGTRALEMMGVLPVLDVGDYILGFELRSYWLPFSGTLGPDLGRWHGPLGHAGKTGAAAAFLVVLSVGLKGRSRWVFGVVGVLTLLLTASRGSMIAAAAGALAVVLFGENALTRRIRRRWLLLGLGGIAVIGLAGVLLRNPNLTGRTTYWSVALDVWSTSPVTGVGSTGMQSSELAMAGTNAHNVVLDAMVKFGLLGTLLVLGILALSVILAVKAIPLKTVAPLGLVTTYLVIGMSEADTEWMRMTLPWLWLVLATTLAGRTVEERPSAPAPLSSA
jgi:O-antigen ligase